MVAPAIPPAATPPTGEESLRAGTNQDALQALFGDDVTACFGKRVLLEPTLNALAGLVTSERGRIALHEQLLFQRDGAGPTISVPARNRRIGYVFQHYALFPHLTALENGAYALREDRGAMTARSRCWIG